MTTTTTTTTTTIDQATAERLSRALARAFETFEAPDDVFDPDLFCDLNMPVWRFQLQGAAAFAAQLRNINQGPSRVEVTRTVPTVDGFVQEHVEHQDVGGEDHSARRMWLCRLRDGRIAEVVGYCSGEWDEALRQRHAREAPMIRP